MLGDRRQMLLFLRRLYSDLMQTEAEIKYIGWADRAARLLVTVEEIDRELTAVDPAPPQP